jgi:hypothetical protein
MPTSDSDVVQAGLTRSEATMEALPSSETRAQPRAPGSPVPLTAWQRYVWNLYSQGRRTSDLRLCEGSLKIRGPLDEDLLGKVINTIVRRHESLRTRIVLTDGIPRQQIVPASDYLLEKIDLAGGPVSEVWERVHQFSNRFLHEQIDWSLDSPFSAKLLKLSELEQVLLVGIDHMVGDDASSGIIRREIASLYQQGEHRLREALPNTSLQFADYAVWQQNTLEAWRSRHEPYWRERLSRAAQVNFPSDDTQQEQQSLRWITTRYPLGAQLSEKLRVLAWKEKMLLPLVVLSVVVNALSRWCDQPEWSIDFQSHGRQGHPEFASTVGYLITYLRLHFDVRGDESLHDLLKRAHLEYWAAVEHQDYGRLPDCLQTTPATICFDWAGTNWSRATASPPRADGQVEMAAFPLCKTEGDLLAPSRYLSFTVLPEDEHTAAGIVIRVAHPQDLASRSTMERLGLSIRLFAEAFTENPLVIQRALRLAS